MLIGLISDTHIPDRAKQIPVGSNINSGRYIRESIVKIGENNNKHRVFFPINKLNFTNGKGKSGYALSKKLTIKYTIAHPAKLNSIKFSGKQQRTIKGIILHTEGENNLRKSRLKLRIPTPAKKYME